MPRLTAHKKRDLHVQALASNGKLRSTPSGLSLALMESEHANDNGDEDRRRTVGVNADASSAGGVALEAPVSSYRSGDEAALQRQRVALHHPPPVLYAQFTVPPLDAVPIGPRVPAQQQQLQGGLLLRRKPGIYPHAGEYGYGYNSSREPLSSGTSLGGLGAIGGPPGLVTASPSPQFLSATPPFCPSPFPSAPGSAKASVQSSPVSSRMLLAPPFVNPMSLQGSPISEPALPANLVHQGQNQPPDSVTSGASISPGRRLRPRHATDPPFMSDAVGVTGDDTGVIPMLPPLSSLDVLQASPFKFATSSQTGGAADRSLLSSLSGTAVAAVTGDDPSFGFSGPSNLAGMSAAGAAYYGAASSTLAATWRDASLVSGGDPALRGSSLDTGCGSSAAGDHILSERPLTSFEDMPFAVDFGPMAGVGMGMGVGGTPTDMGGASNPLGHDGRSQTPLLGSFTPAATVPGVSSSQVVTSLAHRCATAGRLKLFSSTSAVGVVDGDPLHPSNAGMDGASEWVATGDGGSSDTPDVAADLSSLTEMLEEFRTFGATLNKSAVSSPSGGDIAIVPPILLS